MQVMYVDVCCNLIVQHIKTHQAKSFDIEKIEQATSLVANQQRLAFHFCWAHHQNTFKAFYNSKSSTKRSLSVAFKSLFC